MVVKVVVAIGAAVLFVTFIAFTWGLLFGTAFLTGAIETQDRSGNSTHGGD